jgi:hypothetical protein
LFKSAHGGFVAQFQLPEDLIALHDDVIRFASALQVTIAQSGGCKSMSSEALNVLSYYAVLAHRGIRTLCEEGWAPLAPILNRTQLDILANCIAVVADPTIADYMGFKYMSDFHRKWLTDPAITDPEKKEAEAALALMVKNLVAPDQAKAYQVIAEAKQKVYFFQPEYATTRAILDLSPHPIHNLYKMFSGVTHGNFAGKMLFDDDPVAEVIDPREHPKTSKRVMVASSRLLLEICYIRDQWDNLGVALNEYNELVQRIIAFA